MVRLIPMREDEFRGWLENAIRDYADEKVRAGNWDPASALEQSKQTYQDLLPEGLASKNQYLFSIQDDALAQNVGMIWFALNDHGRRQSAFVCDFLIFEQFRRHGYGMQALHALEGEVRQLGLDTISLHVFGHNLPARSLYEKMGYVITNINMTKDLNAHDV
jgi:ribosomal protein S18 acetylase RimI-like enzyme